MMYGYAMRCGASGHTKIGIPPMREIAMQERIRITDTWMRLNDGIFMVRRSDNQILEVVLHQEWPFA